jgi:uncharacterized protein YcbK (DUF882 family)
MRHEHRVQHDGFEQERSVSRRRFLQLSAGAAAGLLIAPAHAGLKPQGRRQLSMHNLHTGEKLTRTYWADGQYLTEPLAEFNHLLRDFRTDETHQMDPHLMDVLYRLQHKVGSHRPFEIISGYRSPKTNALLRSHSSGVAKRSLHMQGKAIDIRLPGQELAHLRKAALSLHAGGVGYYPKSDFIHVDTGRVRYW